MSTRPFEPPRPEAAETRACWVWLDPVANLIRGRFKPGAEVVLEDAEECVRTCIRIAAGRQLPALIDLRWLRSQSAEARAYFSGPEALRLSHAVALLIDSPLSRAIGNFYLGFNRPSVPTRLFTDEAAAQEWLQTFLRAAA